MYVLYLYTYIHVLVQCTYVYSRHRNLKDVTKGMFSMHTFHYPIKSIVMHAGMLGLNWLFMYVHTYYIQYTTKYVCTVCMYIIHACACVCMYIHAQQQFVVFERDVSRLVN